MAVAKKRRTANEDRERHGKKEEGRYWEVERWGETKKKRKTEVAGEHSYIHETSKHKIPTLQKGIIEDKYIV